MSSASGAAGAAPPLDPPPKLGLPGSRPGSLDGLATFQYVPESIQQVMLIQELQEKVAELEEALKREQDRSKLLLSDLSRLRRQRSLAPGGSASSGGSSPRLASPSRLGSLSLDSSAAAAGGPAPAGGGSPFAAAAGGEGEGGAAPPPRAAAATDTVVVSRAALELLYLKERAMDAAKDGIVIADCSQPDMPLIYANEGFARMTGYSRSDVLGRNCRFLQDPPASAAGAAAPREANTAAVNELRQSIKAGQPCVVQLMNYKRNGDPFINYLSLNPVHDALGRLTHYVGVQSDITELVQHRRAELAARHAALQAAAATEAKSQFLARMSHEIRTPLNGMIAVGQLLADTPLSPAQWDLVNTIRCSGETLLTLITDILDFSRIEANKMVLSCAEYRLQSVIEAAMEIAGLHAAQKRLHVAYNVGQSVPAVVMGDAQRLQQILLNILNNAVKFTECGEILLEVWADEEAQQAPQQAQQAPQQAQQAQQGSQQAAAQQAAAEGGQGVPKGQAGVSSGAAAAPAVPPRPEQRTLMLQFSVRDTGIGIEREDIGRLFQSFSQVDASPTRRHGGSGLGLAICQRLCEAMGGRMWAESSGPGEGSLFRWCIRVRLPDTPPGSSRGGASGSGGATPGGSSRCSLECGPSGGSATTGSARSSSDCTSGGGTPLAAGGRGLSGGLADLAGRRVLLVEQCPMVRQVVALALRRWGCSVCAVASEAEAAARLRMGGAAVASTSGLYSPPARGAGPSPDVAPGLAAGQGPEGRTRRKGGSKKRRHLELEHAGQWLDYEFQAPGPYDVVVQDLQHQTLLQRLMVAAHTSEAQRVVFLGWPGQNEPEDRADGSVAGDAASLAGSVGGSTVGGGGGTGRDLADLAGGPPGAYDVGGGLPEMRGADYTAQPPRQLAEQLAQAQTRGGRQLGYVVVTRPVRQGRLRLALEEVLSMQLEAEGYGDSAAAAAAVGSRSLPPVAEREELALPGGGGLAPPSRAGSAAAPLPGSPGDALNPAVLLGLVGSDPSSCDDASSLGSRASSSSNLRCAGSALIRAAASYTHLEAVAAAAAAPLRLLLAEDNAINMKVALGILKRMGCTNVVTAEDGEAALEALHAAGGVDAFDVILMDLHMPKKGGLEAVRDIRRTWPRYRTKIIAVTADAFEDTRDNCIANGFDGWLAKPFRVEEFARVLAACRSGTALTPVRKNV